MLKKQYEPTKKFSGTLGIESKGGRVKFMGYIWPEQAIRPNYSKIKKIGFHPISFCVKILCGAKSLPDPQQIVWFENQEEWKREYFTHIKRIAKATPKVKKSPSYDEAQIKNDFSRYLSAFLRISRELVSAIEDGIIPGRKAGSTYVLDPLYFVKWAIDFGYNLPDVLRIQKVGDKIQWAGPSICEDLGQTFPKHPAQKNEAEETDLLFIAFKARLALSDGEIITKHGDRLGGKPQIQDWLKENFPDISWNESKLKYISTIVNNGYRLGSAITLKNLKS